MSLRFTKSPFSTHKSSQPHLTVVQKQIETLILVHLLFVQIRSNRKPIEKSVTLIVYLRPLKCPPPRESASNNRGEGELLLCERLGLNVLFGRLGSKDDNAPRAPPK